MSEIHELARYKSKEKVEIARKLILNNPNIVHSINRLKNTPLHVAASNGSIRMINLLIKMGADVNALGHYGAFPLDTASENGHIKAVKLLIAKGAKINPRALYLTIVEHLDIAKLLVANGAWIDNKDIQLKRLREAYLTIVPILESHQCDSYYRVYHQLYSDSDLKNLLTTSKTIFGLRQIQLSNSLESMPENIKEQIFTILANNNQVSRVTIDRIRQLKDNKIDLRNIDIGKLHKDVKKIKFPYEQDDLKYLSIPLTKIKLACIMEMSPKIFEDFIKHNSQKDINKSRIEYLLNSEDSQINIKRKLAEALKNEEAFSSATLNNISKRHKNQERRFL